jgi:PAS domain S-box-containing protein
MPDNGPATDAGLPRARRQASAERRLQPLGAAGRRLLALIAVVLLLLCAAFATATWRDHADALNKGWEDADRAATSVAEHAARSLAVAQLVTEHAAEAVMRDGPDAFRGRGHASLLAFLRNAPQLRFITVLDAAGGLRGSSQDPDPPPLDLSDAPYFPPLRDGAETFVHPLMYGRLYGTWFFGHALAVRDRSGRLVGVVQAAIPGDDFQRVQSGLRLGPAGRSGLFGLPGGQAVMVAPLPASPPQDLAAVPEVSWAPPATILAEAAGAPAGRYELADADGAPLLVAWRRIPAVQPLVAVAALPRAAALAPFQEKLSRNVALLVLAAALVIGLGWALAAALAQGAIRRRAAEAGRRELSALLEATGDGVVVLDHAWRVTFANSRAALGLARGVELVGRSFWEGFPDLFGGSVWRACEETMQRRITATARVTLPHDNRHFVAESHPREDGGLVILFRDVTEERHVVERLAEREARFRTLFSAIDEGYCLCEMILDEKGRPVDYRFLEVNPLFQTMTGLKDAAGKTAREMLPGLEAHWIETYARVGLGGETLRFEQGSEAMGRWFDVFAAPVVPRGRFALVFKDITARRATEAALREGEARLRRVLDSLYVSVALLEPDGTLLEVNSTPLDALGLRLEEVRGTVFWDLPWWSCDPAARDRVRDACLAAASGRASRFDMEVLRPGGSVEVLDFQVAPLRDEDGRIIHLVPLASDIGRRRAAELALAESEARLRLAQEAADIGVFERDIPGGRAHWSPAMFRLWGVDPAGRGPWVDDSEYLGLLHPDDREAHRARRDAMRADPTQTRFSFEFRIRHGTTGEVRWLVSRGEMVRDAVGRPVLVRGVNHDVTERRRGEERQMLLAREVDHRAKNALAVVQSIVGLTRHEDPARFRAAVTGRIAAMARAHTLLAREGWDGAELRELLDEELAPYRHPETPERVTLAGPNLGLVAGAAQPLAMALHELATNAAKYGALSTPEGRVAITWEASPLDGLALRWTETGGPAVAGTPARTGFGSSVIRSTVERQLGGTTRFEWLPGGLVCVLTLPPGQLRPTDQPRS